MIPTLLKGWEFLTHAEIGLNGFHPTRPPLGSGGGFFNR